MRIKKRAIARTKQMRFDCDFPPLSHEECNFSARGNSGRDYYRGVLFEIVNIELQEN